MALVYPGSAAINVSPSALSQFLPGLEAGRQRFADQRAFDAAAQAFGGGQTGSARPGGTAIEALMGIGRGGPFTRPETQQPARTARLPELASPGQPLDVVNGSHAAASGAGNADLTAYFQNARAAESGGNDLAANPRSSALGRYQFLDSTWRGLMQQYPELGLTASGRTDPAQQERAMQVFTRDNARTLSGAGVPVNPGTLYAAHFLGAGGASNVLRQDPNSPLSSYLEPGVIEANPHLRGMTVGDFSTWANSKGGGSNGGYQAPTMDVGAGQGSSYVPDESTLRSLMASEATRPLAVSLIQAQQQQNASQGRYVTEQGQDGSVWQRDTLTGQMQVLMTPQQARGAASYSQTPVFLRDADGNQHIGQVSSTGGLLINGESMAGLPDGWQVVSRPEGYRDIDLGGSRGVFDPNTGEYATGPVIQGSPSSNQNVSIDPETSERVMSAAPGSPEAIEQEQATRARELAGRQSDERASYILNAIESGLGNSGFWTTGPMGRIGRTVGVPDAVTLDETVNTVKSNLGFNELQAMRDASPTGGALGQVTERELAFLQNTVASLNPDMGEAALDQNLRLIGNLIRRQAVYREIDRQGLGLSSEQAQQMLNRYPLPVQVATSPAPPAQTQEMAPQPTQSFLNDPNIEDKSLWQYMTPEHRALWP